MSQHEQKPLGTQIDQRLLKKIVEDRKVIEAARTMIQDREQASATKLIRSAVGSGASRK